MKTAKELTEEIIQIAKWNGVFIGELETHTSQLLSEFESEIRKDQAKKTLTTWAKTIDDIEPDRGSESISRESIFIALMNSGYTKAIKD